MTAAQGGSAEAFAALYDRHAAGVARVLASFAGPDHDLLDDLVQDVFLRVIKGLPTYAPSRPFANWLFTVALNVGRNHARRRRQQPTVELEEAADVATPVAASDLTAQLMEQVAGLPTAMQEVVALRVGSDLSYRDISELLGIPEATARSRLHAAVGLLRRRCAPSPTKGKGTHGPA